MAREAIGRLSERLKFQTEARGDDNMGGGTVSWTNFAEDWASVEPISARELTDAQQQFAPTRYRVKMRQRGDLTAAMRAVWTTNGDMVLNVREIQDPGPREPFMMLVLEAAVAV